MDGLFENPICINYKLPKIITKTNVTQKSKATVSMLVVSHGGMCFSISVLFEKFEPLL